MLVHMYSYVQLNIGVLLCLIMQERLLKPVAGFAGYSSEMRELAAVISRVSKRPLSRLSYQLATADFVCPQHTGHLPSEPQCSLGRHHRVRCCQTPGQRSCGLPYQGVLVHMYCIPGKVYDS